MSPYYDHGGITIYHGDCREILPLLGRFDLLLTDPPFGIGLTKKTSDFRDSKYFDDGVGAAASTLYRDDYEHVRRLIEEVIPLALTLADRALIFSGQRMLWAYPEPAAMGTVYLPNGAGRCAWGFQCAQPILFYGKDPMLQDGKGARPNSFRTEQPNSERIDHPCPKPLRWMQWAVERASRPGELIVDPFMGSGTTLLAAKNHGRRAIGIDNVEKFCRLAVKRLAQEVLFS